MNRQRKTNRRPSSSSSCSSENHPSQNIEQTLPRVSQSSSSKRPTYPNVPKRTRLLSSIDDQETIETDSRIDIIPSERHSQRPEGYSSIRSPSNRTEYIRHTLDLITKYTSPRRISPESDSSPLHSQIHVLSNNQSVSEATWKRTLSPLDDTDQQIRESKRTKSIVEFEEDDEELSRLIDHRRSKQILSQNINASISSQVTDNGEQRKATGRKPTVRKLSTNQRKPSASQPALIKPLLIDVEETSHTQDEVRHHSISIPFPIKLSIENCIDSLPSNSKANISSTPICSSKPTFENAQENSSPISHNRKERTFSSTSSDSLFFDTPNSSFSRTTTNNITTSTPQAVMKTDCETQIARRSNVEMINELIAQMNLNAKENENDQHYNSMELSKKFFQQCTSVSLEKRHLLMKKQFFSFGRYEMDVLYPSNDIPNSTIYACDRCLKHFSGSPIAFERHTAKCLESQPPGKLVFHKGDLAIFQIGESKMAMSQRIYVKFLCRIARLFLNPHQSINDTKIDRFAYYILCRRDPILSQSQPSIYRLRGYFSKPLHQHAQQLTHNLSCLFVLPPFIRHGDDQQLLIAFSYFLIRSNASTNLIYSSPVRPLDPQALAAFRTYWRDILFAYLINHHHSSIKPLALDHFAHQTTIHPRDILSSLYSHSLIVPHPADNSAVYLHANAYRSMTSLNLHQRNEVLLLLEMNLINTNEEKRLIIDKQNSNRSHDSGIEAIILD